MSTPAPTSKREAPTKTHTTPTSTPPLPSVRLHFNRLSFNLAYVLFFSTAVLQFGTAISYASAEVFETSPELLSGNLFGAMVNLAAGFHYARLSDIDPKETDELTMIRYSDWYATTPLMLIDFFSLSRTLYSGLPYLVVSVVLNTCMILLGHLGAILRNERYYYAGILFEVALVPFFLVGTVTETHPNPWLYGFAGLWIFYPFLYFLHDPIYYNLLDILSKSVFGIATALITFYRAEAQAEAQA
jgi:bacteriorhodopsin